jgi:predicted nucleotidyltransferase
MGRAPQLDEVIALLKQHESFFREKGITHLAVFGSVARGDASEHSDIDLVIEVDETKKFSLLDLIGLEFDVTDRMGKKVDVLTWGSFGPRTEARVRKDAVHVF